MLGLSSNVTGLRIYRDTVQGEWTTRVSGNTNPEDGVISIEDCAISEAISRFDDNDANLTITNTTVETLDSNLNLSGASRTVAKLITSAVGHQLARVA